MQGVKHQQGRKKQPLKLFFLYNFHQILINCQQKNIVCCNFSFQQFSLHAKYLYGLKSEIAPNGAVWSGSTLFAKETSKQEGQEALNRSPEFCLKLTYRYLMKADHVPGDTRDRTILAPVEVH